MAGISFRLGWISVLLRFVWVGFRLLLYDAFCAAGAVASYFFCGGLRFVWVGFLLRFIWVGFLLRFIWVGFFFCVLAGVLLLPVLLSVPR